MDKELKLLTIQPDKSLSDFVNVFYFFENPSDIDSQKIDLEHYDKLINSQINLFRFSIGL